MLDKNNIAIFVLMQTQVSQEVLSILTYAREEACRAGDRSISTDHLLLGILRHKDNQACRTLAELGIDAADMKVCLEKAIFKPQSIPYDQSQNIIFSRSAQNTLNISIIEANIAQSDKILPVHLLLAICACAGSRSLEYLKSHGVDHASIKTYLKDRNLLQAKLVKTDEDGKRTPVSILKIISSSNKIAS